ncbi:MAG: hypothetical protein M3R02_01250 [Chloroflexota bacterium]|nr:hypothetical protein [Chloroflexota bacterium]
MTTPQPSPTEDHDYHERVTEFVRWGSRLTPEEREWQITKLLPVVLAALEDLADDAANAHAAGKDAAGKPVQ